MLKLASVADSLPETTKNEIQPKNSFIDFVLSGLNFCSLQNLEFGIDCDSRIALVGPNGAGKSTLLKLMTGDITPTKGTVNRHSHLSIGRYHQHSVDVLDNDATVLDFFSSSYPNSLTFKREMEEWRAYLGHYGITGEIPCYIPNTMCSSRSCKVYVCLAASLVNHTTFLIPIFHATLGACMFINAVLYMLCSVSIFALHPL